MASMLLSVLALGASLLVPAAYAERLILQQHNWYKDYSPQPIDYCFYACNTAVGYITFDFSPAFPEDYYASSFLNTLGIQSIYACAQKYCTPEEAEHGRSLFNGDAQLYANINLPSLAEYTLSPEQLANITVLDETAAFATAEAPLDSIAIPDEEFWGLGKRTIKEFYVNWYVSWDFSFACIAFWGFVILVGMVHRLSQLMKKSSSQGRESSWWLWTRRYLILPATFGKHQAEAVGNTFTIPPRLESLILIIYLIMNIIYCLPAYNLFVGNLYYPKTSLQLARYIGDRTGLLSICQLPMVWVFAARNDPFMWLTGWSFATYNRFHKWIARISVAHAIAHSIAWTMYEFVQVGGKAYYDASWKEEYWYMGGVATVLMSLMLGASAYYFRNKYYDVFLIVHIIMAVVFLVALWYHVRIFNGEFAYFIWPCVAMWSIDRLLRIGRTVYVSMLPRFSKGVRATATYHRTTEMVRLDITDFFPEKPVVPGQFYYLYMPNGLRGYESHPFTLCSWRRPDSLPPSPQISSDFKDVELTVRSASENGSSTAKVAHSLLVRPYKGMTGRLQKKLLSSDESVASIRETVFLEGPYGEKLDLSGYSDVLVICGGSGITAAISHSHFLMAQNSTTKVHIAWAVPQRHLPDDICANELVSVIHTDLVSMTVYLTSAAEDEAHDPEKLPTNPPYEIHTGRPDIEGIMREQRRQASKSLAVVTCGTPQMSDACRQAVVKVLGEDGVHLEYFNETMIW